jgi:hypothetical protein
MTRAFAVAAAVLIGAGSCAFALDNSTREKGPRSPVELCCTGTPPLPPIETSAAAENQALLDWSQVAPATAMKPGLDGADWSCRRPDGSQRCVSEAVAPH